MIIVTNNVPETKPATKIRAHTLGLENPAAPKTSTAPLTLTIPIAISRLIQPNTNIATQAAITAATLSSFQMTRLASPLSNSFKEILLTIIVVV